MSIKFHSNAGIVRKKRHESAILSSHKLIIFEVISCDIMKYFLLLTFLFNGVTAFSQDSIAYFDKNWKPLSSSVFATYYRKTKQTPTGFIARNHFASNNQLQMEAECSAISPEIIYHGSCKRFYENGNAESVGNYIKNQKDGIWKSYYESGKPMDEIYYTPEEKTSRAKYYQHWDEAGNPELLNGTGIYKSNVVVDGTTYWQDVLDSTLIGAFYFNHQDTVFALAEQQAEYKGGFPKFYQGIGKAITYPKQARRMGIDGRVFVAFVIGKDGKPRDPEVLKGIGAGCDEESIRVIMLQQDWQPALHRGKPVCQKMVLPVMYKLN
jgi:TonB family protein